LDHYICSFSLLTQTITLMHCLLFSYSKLWCLDNITTDILMCYLNEIPWLFEHGALDADDPSDVLSMETRRSFPDARCGGSTSNASSAARERLRLLRAVERSAASGGAGFWHGWRPPRVDCPMRSPSSLSAFDDLLPSANPRRNCLRHRYSPL
jgi:hypothetical protein